jgi:phosphatidate cytidylyltransferase-like protein
VEEIRKIVHGRTLDVEVENTLPFIEAILSHYGNKVVGIFMYGSKLSAVTATATSFPDFFVITEGYRGVFKKISHWALSYFLPPHIYHLRLDEQLRCKYNLVSLKRFQRECSRRAKDIYILGRFGKRVALIYARDAQARRKLTDCCFNAMSNVVPWTLRGMQKPFSEKDFTLSCLNLSYAGETRVETSSKVPKLFESEKEFYLETYPAFLKKHPKAQKLAQLTSNGSYRPSGGRFVRWLRRIRFRWFLRRSRIRGILRWPKFLVTVDEWVDIILSKIERTKGIKLDVTDRQRRHPLIFAWPHFFRLLRSGAIKSAQKAPEEKSEENKPK